MAVGIAFVLLRDAATLSAASIARELAARYPDLPAATEVEDGKSQDGFGSWSLSLGDSSIVIGEMPAPVPWSDLEGPCATSILWRNAAQEVRQHTRHLIVTALAEIEPIPLATLLTQATAATLAACDQAMGVYWGNATLLVPKNIFLDFATEVLPHGPPLHIWIDVRVGRDSDQSSSGFTAGMKALGHMELEAKQSPETPKDLHERLMSLAGYVIENGPVIHDGDTVGQDADEKIRIVYSPSLFGHEDKVMRLVYETASPSKPWWKFW